jgi:hypothetical protein
MTKSIVYVVAAISSIFPGLSFAQSPRCDNFGGMYASSFPDGHTEWARIDCVGGATTCALHDNQAWHVGTIEPVPDRPDEWTVHGTIGEGLGMRTSDHCRTLTFSNRNVWTKITPSQ